MVARLADREVKPAGVDDGVSVAILAGDLGGGRDSGELLDGDRSDEAGMVGGSAAQQGHAADVDQLTG